MGSLEFFLFGLWLSYYAFIFVCVDAFVELHAMDEKNVQ